MICNINYSELIKYHIKQGNDVTTVYKNVKHVEDRFIGCQVLNLDESSRVIGVGENVGLKNSANINMEMYIMKTDLFVDMIYECIRSGMQRKIKSYIRANLDKLKVEDYEFKGYLSCINSIKDYFDTNLDILNEEVSNELFYGENPIYTKSQDEPPTKYTDMSKVSNSIVANGSFIEGEVKNCILH